MAALDVAHHAPGFRVLHDGLATLTGKVIDLLHDPAARFRIRLGASKMMFGTVSLGLVFGGNTNPDSDILF